MSFFPRKSSAITFSKQLKQAGIGQSQIVSEHLFSTYKQLSVFKDRADFSNIKNILSKNPPANQNVSNIDCVGVIVETRNHPLLERIVIDFVARTGLQVQLFHGKLNLDFILQSKVSALIEDGKVILTQLNTEDFFAKDYNALFLSEDFWHTLIGRNKVFVFQTDSILCEQSKYNLNDFVKFDYIGGWWQRERPIGLIMDGGNGGFSIRDWQKSIDCLKRFSPTNWPGGEDGYFAFHIDLIGGKVGRKKSCSQFATQDYFTYKSYGCHKISRLNKQDKIAFAKYCPQAKCLL
jgi:hypothetical protein